MLRVMVEAPFLIAAARAAAACTRGGGGGSSTSPRCTGCGLRRTSRRTGGKAWAGGVLQGRRARRGAPRRDLQLRVPGLRTDRAGRGPDRRPGEDRTASTRARSSRRSCWPAAIKRLIEPDEVAELVAYLCGRAGVVHHRRHPCPGRRLDGALSGGRACHDAAPIFLELWPGRRRRSSSRGHHPGQGRRGRRGDRRGAGAAKVDALRCGRCCNAGPGAKPSCRRCSTPPTTWPRCATWTRCWRRSCTGPGSCSAPTPPT